MVAFARFRLHFGSIKSTELNYGHLISATGQVRCRFINNLLDFAYLGLPFHLSHQERVCLDKWARETFYVGQEQTPDEIWAQAAGTIEFR